MLCVVCCVVVVLLCVVCCVLCVCVFVFVCVCVVCVCVYVCVCVSMMHGFAQECAVLDAKYIKRLHIRIQTCGHTDRHTCIHTFHYATFNHT